MPFQPRFIAYAASLGRKPESLPRGIETNLSFAEWVRARWSEWKTLTGWRGPILSGQDRAAFDAWLAKVSP